MISKELLMSSCEKMGIEIDVNACGRLDKYAELLVDYNKKVNLTAITAPDDIVIKHFVDSLCLSNYVNLEKRKILDIGTGAGFPGVALLCMNPSYNITMLDSVKKKLEFVTYALKELGLEATVLNARAEETANQEEYREKFDLVTSRAVASLNVLSEYSVPFVRVGGYFAPLKAVLDTEERISGFSAIRLLGARVEYKHKYSLPDGSMREIILAKKLSQTSAKYPRPYAQISKKPL